MFGRNHLGSFRSASYLFDAASWACPAGEATLWSWKATVRRFRLTGFRRKGRVALRRNEMGAMQKVRFDRAPVPGSDGMHHLRVDGIARGWVRKTKGGFYRAGSYLSGISCGPFFSFARAARQAMGHAVSP